MLQHEINTVGDSVIIHQCKNYFPEHRRCPASVFVHMSMMIGY